MSWRCCNKTCSPARRTVAEISSGPSALLINARKLPLMYHVNIVTVTRIGKRAKSIWRRHNCGAENLCMMLPPAFTIGLGDPCATLRENRLEWFGQGASKRFDNLERGAEVRTCGCSCSTESKTFQQQLTITSGQLGFQQGERAHVTITKSPVQVSFDATKTTQVKSETRERWVCNNWWTGATTKT